MNIEHRCHWQQSMLHLPLGWWAFVFGFVCAVEVLVQVLDIWPVDDGRDQDYLVLRQQMRPPSASWPACPAAELVNLGSI
jgi:hypothetical protein